MAIQIPWCETHQSQADKIPAPEEVGYRCREGAGLEGGGGLDECDITQLIADRADRRGYARVIWHPEDIQSLDPDITDEDAVAFLERNSRRIADRLVEHGWDIIEALLDSESYEAAQASETH